jgi:hypothetical protein
VLRTARHLRSLPGTEEAVREGRLSGEQVAVIADAAAARPEAERSLLDAAGRQPLGTLKLNCRRVLATSDDQRTSYDNVRKSRYFRHWIEGSGAIRIDGRFTPDAGAALIAAVKSQADKLESDARRAGITESRQSIEADALVQLTRGTASSQSARGNGTAAGDGKGIGTKASRGADISDDEISTNDTSDDHGEIRGAAEDARSAPHPISPIGETVGTVGERVTGPTAMVHVRVDHAALVRGHVEVGETCEIPGVGPIPVEVAEALAVDSILSVLVTDGVDVTTVAHSGRSIPTALKRALLERDPTCVIPGCEVRTDLEIDHVVPYSQGGVASLENLVRLCHWHHYLKTHHRYRIRPGEVGESKWMWEPPPNAHGGDHRLIAL